MCSRIHKENPDPYSRCPEQITRAQANLEPQHDNGCLLNGLKLFSDLPIQERERISTRITTQRFTRGEHILHYGDKDRNVYFVFAGQVKAISYSESGKQVSFEELGPGDFFGELAAIDGLERSTDVVCTGDCLIGVMSHSNFILTNAENPEIALKIMQRLTRLARNLLGRIKEFSTLSVNDRIQAELLRIAGPMSASTNAVVIENPPTHEEIAFRISTHREAVTRELKRLEKDGVITWNRTVHQINDLHRLRKPCT